MDGEPPSAEICSETRRFLSFSPSFMALFEYKLPCDLRSLRQLHGPLTRSEQLRNAIQRCVKTGYTDHVVEVLYTSCSLRAVGLIVDIVPIPKSAPRRSSSTDTNNDNNADAEDDPLLFVSPPSSSSCCCSCDDNNKKKQQQQEEEERRPAVRLICRPIT